MVTEKYQVYDDRTNEILYRSNSKQLCMSYINNYLESKDASHIWLDENPDYEKRTLTGGTGSIVIEF
jgi:hypothetical protein